MLLDIINEFIKQEGITPARWELIVTMSPSMIRGSLLPLYFWPTELEGIIGLNQSPEAENNLLDYDLCQTSMMMLEEDRKVIVKHLQGTGKDAQKFAAKYVEAMTERLKILALPKRELLDRALASPDFTNTGVCGETANLLARILNGPPNGRGSMDNLVGALKMEDLPRIYLVVSIGESHRFLVEKNGDDVTLLQSWIGRFSLATWLAKGRPLWKLNGFVQALQAALPEEEDSQVNESYNLLFNVPGVDRTRSPHTTSQVSVDIYLTPDDDNDVRVNLRRVYEEGLQLWRD